MEIYKILMLVVSFLFVFSAVKKMRKGMSFGDYALGRGFIIYVLTVFKLAFIIVTVYHFLSLLDWSFLNYKISF